MTRRDVRELLALILVLLATLTLCAGGASNTPKPTGGPPASNTSGPDG
jgi:hypothetical protein